MVYVGLARTTYIYVKRCIYVTFGRECTKYTVIYGAYIYDSGQPRCVALCGSTGVQ